MPTRKRPISPATCQRRLDNGYGNINSDKYKPFFTARDESHSTVFRYMFHGQMHVLIGMNSFRFFLDQIFNWKQRGIKAIYEEVDIPTEKIISLSHTSGIPYTKDKYKRPKPLITPFVIEDDDGRKAYFILGKKAESQSDPSRKKGSYYNDLALQEMYWKNQVPSVPFQKNLRTGPDQYDQSPEHPSADAAISHRHDRYFR